MSDHGRDLLDDLPIGREFNSHGRTLSEGEFSLLVDLTWMTNPEHSDRSQAAAMGVPDRTLPGPLVIAVAAGLSGSAGFRHELTSRGVRSLAMLTLENIRFSSPVFPGDTLFVVTTITEARPTRDGVRGVMRVRDVVRNASEVVVCEYERVILFDRA